MTVTITPITVLSPHCLEQRPYHADFDGCRQAAVTKCAAAILGWGCSHRGSPAEQNLPIGGRDHLVQAGETWGEYTSQSEAVGKLRSPPLVPASSGAAKGFLGEEQLPLPS